MAVLGPVSKCQECIAEIRNIIVGIGIEAERIMILSGNVPVKRKAKNIYTAVRKLEKLLRGKNGGE